MSLVGDIIMELRQRIPDAPGVSNGPAIVSLKSTTIQGGGPQFGGGQNPQSFAVTSFNQWGETGLGPGDIHQITIGPTDNSVSIEVGSSTAPNFLGTYIYQAGDIPTGGGSPAGLNDRWGPFPIVTGDDTYIIGAGAPPGSPGSVGPTLSNPPLRYTAFHPDTDGNFLGAYAAYRLLNRAISEMVKIAGGIIDVTGVQSQINQSMYRIDSPNPPDSPGPGQGTFYQFVNAWYDGYPMDIVQRSMMYLRNSAAGFSGILSYEQDGPQSVIQVWPQSNRTGGQNFLAAPLSTTANSFLVSDGTGFLSIGLALIDSEIVAYSQITAGGTVFSGVTRGMGGTAPAAHNIYAPVTELNIRLSGYRMPPIYRPGDSQTTLMVPQAWETPLVLHMLSQVRSMEQDDATAEKLMADFVQMAEKVAKGSRLGKMKPRQIPIWGQTGADARNVNGIGFGWLIN